MKVALSIYSLDTLKKAESLIDVAVLNVPHYAYIYNDDFDINEAISYAEKHHIEPVLAINHIYMEHELDEIKAFVQKYSKYKFVVSDLGVVELFLELGLINNVIYDPDTLICNSSDLSLYQQYGFDALAMSNEITMNDVISSFNKTQANLYYQVFGRKLMFYSKRKLLSLYEQYKGISFKKDNLTLVEEKRTYHIPVFENENGIYCFRHYNISLVKEISNLSFLKYAYFESITIDDDVMMEVLTTYHKVINNESSSIDAEQIINELVPTEDGFAYNDTVYVKEKIVQ